MLVPAFTLRPATIDDYRFCYILLKKNMMVLFTRHWGGWDPKKFREGFRPKDTKIVMIGARRFGYVCVYRKNGTMYVDNLQLSSSVHGQGIGAKLLENIVKKHGRETLGLTVFADNPALRLYKRYGFKIIKKDGMTLKMERAIND